MTDLERKGNLEGQPTGKGPHAHAPSLMSYLASEPLSLWLSQRLAQGPWAELGGGGLSLFELGDQLVSGLSRKDDLYSFDISEQAKKKASKGKVHYQQVDCTKEIPHAPFSFILDAHYLHCLSSMPQVFHGLGVIWHALIPGGLYAGEVMTAHKNLSFDHDLYFNHHESVLYYEDRPIRTILEAREWEQLFKDAGFEIQYFVCQASIKMIPQRERQIPMSGDPECLRFILKRPA